MSSNVSESLAPKADLCEVPTQRDFIFQAAFLVVIMVVTLLGNVMVCLAVFLFERLRTITNYFIVSLAVSDLLVALISLPFRIDQTTHNAVWCLGIEACVSWILTDLMSSSASICNLAMISVDRYIAIVHPFRYHTVMTAKVGSIMIASVWIYCGLLTGLSLINWTHFGEQHFFADRMYQCRKTDPVYYTIVASVGFYVPLLIVIVMYAFIFRVAVNQARAVAALQMNANGRRGRRGSINLVKEVKAAKTLAIVVGAFVLCWFPFFILLLVSLWNLSLLSPPTLTIDEVKGIRYTFVYVLPAINSTLNPIIYAMFNRDFRKAFGKLFRVCHRRRDGFGDATFSSNIDDTYNMQTTATERGKAAKRTRFVSYDPSEQENSEAQ